MASLLQGVSLSVIKGCSKRETARRRDLWWSLRGTGRNRGSQGDRKLLEALGFIQFGKSLRSLQVGFPEGSNSGVICLEASKYQLEMIPILLCLALWLFSN